MFGYIRTTHIKPNYFECFYEFAPEEVTIGPTNIVVGILWLAIIAMRSFFIYFCQANVDKLVLYKTKALVSWAIKL